MNERTEGMRGLVLARIRIMLFFIFCTASCFAEGECEFSWKSGNGVGGLNGTVYAVTTWDPDGSGPQKEVLVAGGGVYGCRRNQCK